MSNPVLAKALHAYYSAFAKSCNQLVNDGLSAPYIIARDGLVGSVFSLACGISIEDRKYSFNWSAIVQLRDSERRLAMSGKLGSADDVAEFFAAMLVSHTKINGEDLRVRWMPIILEWAQKKDGALFLKVIQ